MSKWKRQAVLAAAVGVGLAGGGLARGSIVGQWIGDNYTTGSGNTWADSSGAGSTATAFGAGPTTTANAFGTHKGINFAGGNGASTPGYFTVSDTASNALGATALSWVAVIKTSSAQTSAGGQFWQKSGLIGKEEGGSVNDWGFGVGSGQAAGADAAYVGVGAPDTTITSGSGVNDGLLHVLEGTWSTAGTMTLYVDGVQVAQNTGAPTAARDANASGGFALGASTVLNNGDTHVFTGQVAELRLYNDLESAAQVAALSSSLRATYAPEPGSVGLLGLTGMGFLLRRRRRRLR